MRRKKKIKLTRKARLLLLTICFILCLIFNKPSTSKKSILKKETLLTAEQKLKVLDNIDKKIDYYNPDYLDRYLSYQQKNQDLPIIQIIKNVNMNLDQIQYVDISPAKRQNTETILVNKYYYLTEEYIPEKLENISINYALSNMRLISTAKMAFEEMAQNAKKENMTIIAMSTYRSYQYQVNLYNRYVKEDGKELADTYSGRPGHSEHQTGLAVDVYNGAVPYTEFENTKEYEWMNNHAHEYGFILRFPKGKETETGYQYEAWHYRYVGIEAAAYIKEHQITLEEYDATILKDW